MYQLIIGNRNYSSWSLRAWLALATSGARFNTTRVTLFDGDWKAKILAHSPAGRVPVLIDGDITIWDSLAIAEYLREREPEAPGWPEARAIASEMHSGFLAVRDELPQNLRARSPLSEEELSGGCREQIARIDAIWSNCYAHRDTRGPWLFGNFGIADVMYVPVALRFVSYDIAVSDRARQFIDATLAFAPVQAWVDAATQEAEAIDFIDARQPASSTALTLG